METLDLKHKFIELRAKGYSYDKLVKIIGKSKQVLINWGKEFEEEINNFKAVEIEALTEKYYLLKEHRIESFGSLLERIKKELVKRDISDVPTDKLIDIALKLELLLISEIGSFNFKSQDDIDSIKRDKRYLDYIVNKESKGKLKAV